MPGYTLATEEAQVQPESSLEDGMMQAIPRATLWAAPLLLASHLAWAAEPVELSTSQMDTIHAAASIPESSAWWIGRCLAEIRTQTIAQGTWRPREWLISLSGLSLALAVGNSF
jgi:hypothetical protein